MIEEELRVEYLVIVDTSNSFCASEKAFNNLLRTNSDITLQNGNLKYKNLEVEYKVQTKKLETQEERAENKRFFHVHLKCNEISKVNDFEGLLRVVKGLLYKVSDIQQTLWDDVSFYYSRRAYPLMHEIENLMRKLITKFMLTNVGLGWTKDSIPEEVKNSVRSSKKGETANYLYNVDFIQLANFLFKEYSPLSVESLIEKLKKTTDVNELSLDELKDFVPKSNWERYFSNLVECEAEYLNKRWKSLYDLRNQIAHNNILGKKDYEEIVRIIGEVKEKLEKAVKSLDKIHIPNKDKEVVAENIASGTNDVFFEFIEEYKVLETIVYSLTKMFGQERKLLSRNVKTLEENGLIDKNIVKEINNLKAIRNIIVHNTEVTLNQDHIKEWTIRCEKVVDSLLEISIDKYEKQMIMEENIDKEKDKIESVEKEGDRRRGTAVVQGSRKE
ncbi:HEPN domain-containing protein [Bacillus thuringiensis]|uniref:HEPN domain-containing protein n=1 Tax=Bacillus thuringiensis TaxID=1428 RepID=UPI00273A7D27|nr:HEPN domain-containing protein [Bacillus thuringiensis]WLP65379.1 HEPN domain-containing protein [Bacillus thuringiensis]